MMERDSGAPSQLHMLEFYTDHFILKGSVTLPFSRLTEVMNTADRDYLSIDQASIAPLLNPTQMSAPNPTPTLVRRTEVRYAVAFNDPNRRRGNQEFGAVRKVPRPCYGFLGAFVFHAHLHMLERDALGDLLERGAELFFPLTQATVYMLDRPDLPPRQHEVIIINRRFLDAIYLL